MSAYTCVHPCICRYMLYIHILMYMYAKDVGAVPIAHMINQSEIHIVAMYMTLKSW